MVADPTGEEYSDQNGEDTSSRPPIALPKDTQLRDQYRIGNVLGAGNFGITYRARDEHLDTTVAIKEYYPREIAGRTDESQVVEPYSSGDTGDFEFGRQRFLEEGRILARFEHDNIVRVRSYFEANGTGYLVMDYYEGKTLADYLAEEGGSLAEDESLEIIQSVLSGLRSVHEKGLLHRDIDPQNIYRRSTGEIVLLDFGAARVAMGERSKSLSVILKPGYAPYEQYHSEGNQGPWTDIYACSATLYRCLTGLKPPEAISRLKEDKLSPPHEIRSSISLEVSMAVMKGLAIRPEQRPSSAKEFSALLGGTLTAGETEIGSQANVVTQQPAGETFQPALDSEATGSEAVSEKTTNETAAAGFLGLSKTQFQIGISAALIGILSTLLLWGIFGGDVLSGDSTNPPGPNTKPEWSNKVEVLMSTESLPKAFLDSLISVASRRENLQLYRTPEKKQAFTLRELRDTLNTGPDSFTTIGAGANHALIEYEFSAYKSSMVEKISSVELFHRPEVGPDKDILYLDRKGRLLGDVVERMRVSKVNLKRTHSFRRDLSLAALLLDGAFTRLSWKEPSRLAVTQLGGRWVKREEGKTEPIRRLQERLLSAILEQDTRYILE